MEAARRLVEQAKVDAVVGPLSGDEGIAIKNYAKQHLDVTFVNGTLNFREISRSVVPELSVLPLAASAAALTAALGMLRLRRAR